MSDSEHTQAPPQNTRSKPRRGFRILLGLSLALNLLVIGAIAGTLAKGVGARHAPPGMREVSAPYVGAFDRADKRAMRAEMRARLPDRSAAIAANKAAYGEFLTVVRAQAFDAVRAAQIMQDQLVRAGRVQELGREVAIARIKAMNFEERSAYADRLQAWLESPKHRHTGKDRKERENR